MTDERRLYRLTYPDTAPRGSRLRTGVIERRLTAEQLRHFERAAAHTQARLISVEPVEED